MNILSIDTSTQILSIALKTDRSYEERMVEGNFSHSENLLGEILFLLDRAKLTLKDMDLLVCTKGPGSFTGLRIGLATLKGISLASGTPIVSVPTLSVIEDSVKLWKGPVLSVLDARKKRFYFRLSKGGEILVSDRDGNPEDLKEELDKLGTEVLVTGPDAELFTRKALEAMPEAKLVVDPSVPRPLSSSLIALGLKKFEADGADDIGEGPVYIRRSDAEEMLLQKAKEAEGR